MSRLKFIKTRDVKSPTRANDTDSWIDMYVPNDLDSIKETPTEDNDTVIELDEELNCFYINPWKGLLIPTWIKTIIEPWFDLVFENKSWVSVKYGLVIGAKVVDSSYRGEIHIHVINTSDEVQYIEPWQKLAQAILRKVELDIPEEITEEEFEAQNNTNRWSWGFWSTWEQ